MKIAILAPPWIKVPPAGYGGIEWVVHYITDELVERGHDVTLFATGDSQTKANLESCFPREQLDKMGDIMYEVENVGNCLRRANEFDVIHDHSGFSAVAFASLVDTPLIHTLHGPFRDEICRFYRHFRNSAHYVAISEYQRSRCPDLQYAGVVYNPIDADSWPVIEKKEDYILAFGRVCPDKGFHTAIEVARRSGRRLIIAGAVQKKFLGYYETSVKPGIDGEQIQFVGEVSLTEKWNLFSKAQAFIFPIQWPEPFGLVMIESMAAGTPVIAFPKGSVPEVIEDGKTGFLVHNIDEMVARLSDLDKIDSGYCRDYVRDKFSISKTTDGYQQVYEQVLTGAHSC